MAQRVSGFAKFLQPLYCFFSAEKFSGNTVASVTPHSSIPGAKKILQKPPYSQHTPKTLELHRQRFSVCLWRVLKIPTQITFFPPSIPLSFPPLLQFRHIRKIYASCQFRQAPFFCEVFTPFCHRFPQWCFYMHERAVHTKTPPRTGAQHCSKSSQHYAPVFSIAFPRFLVQYQLKISVFYRNLFPTASQVPPLKTRTSRVFSSVTAHSSMPVQQVLFIDYRFRRTVIPLSFPSLPTVLRAVVTSNYPHQSKFWNFLLRKFGIRKNKKKRK